MNSNTASPISFSDFVQIKSSESRSSCWHLLNACPAWNTSSDSLGLQHTNRGDTQVPGDTGSHRTLLWPCFAKSLFCYCLFFAKQAVGKIILSAWPDILHGSSSPTPLYCPPHKTVGREGRITWKFTACWAPPTLQRISQVGLEDLGGLLQPKWLSGSEIVARLTTWEGMQTRMKASKPYLLDLIDLGERERKETRNKASVNDGYRAMQRSTARSGGKKQHL